MALQGGLDMNVNLLHVQPADKLNDLRNILDGHQMWLELVKVVKNKKFMLGDNKLSRLKLMAACNLHQSPSSELFLHWGLRGMTLGDLVKLLEQLQLERPLMILKEEEPLRITIQPLPRLVIDSGSKLKLTCSASGFPYPKYIWFEGRTRVSIASSTTGDFTIDSVSSDDQGLYICRVHNSRMDYVFSDWCTVVVNGDAQQGPYSDVSTNIQGGQPALSIVEQPESLVSLQMFKMLRLTCRASGSHRLQYQWFHKGAILDKQTAPILQIDHVNLLHAGEYRCVVRDAMNNQVESNTTVVRVYAEQLAETNTNPNITVHPLDRTEVIGAEICLQVQVSASHYMLAYQWYHNGTPIPGATDRELRFHVKSVNVAGRYQCHVYSLDNLQHRLGETVSEEAKIEVKLPSYTATDKVALLLGVGKYTKRPLPAITNDLDCATICFKKMGYKVISLLNLNLIEMLQAVSMFCDLLEEGVYGVFYFVGHGFQYRGQKYFVPFDAPVSPSLQHCLCAEAVHQAVQLKNPTLFLMIIDCCRTENSEIDEQLPQERYKPHITGNTLIVSASSYGEESYEPREENADEYKFLIPTWTSRGRQGIFSGYLYPILMKEAKIPIIELFNMLQNEFSTNEFRDKYRQHPEIKSNLTENQRSLRDGIDYCGNTEAMNKRCYKYKITHEVPDPMCIHKGRTSDIGISFRPIFSNVLCMSIDWGSLQEGNICIADTDVPKVLWPVARKFDMAGNVRHIVFGNLQRLQGHLKLPTQFTFKDGQQRYRVECTIDFGWPLISAMNQQTEDSVGGETMTATALRLSDQPCKESSISHC